MYDIHIRNSQTHSVLGSYGLNVEHRQKQIRILSHITMLPQYIYK